MATEISSAVFSAFITVLGTIFIVELTDKDALLLLALATRIKPWIAFASGATAFTITTTIIVSVGYVLVQVLPVSLIKLAGGVVMIAFALWTYFTEKKEEEAVATEEEKVLKKTSRGRSAWSIYLSAVLMLAILDLAGDATEVLTIVYVAHYQNLLLVFVACVSALVAASGVETILGNRLGRYLSAKRIRIISLLVFLIIGALVIITTLFPSLNQAFL